MDTTPHTLDGVLWRFNFDKRWSILLFTTINQYSAKEKINISQILLFTTINQYSAEKNKTILQILLFTTINQYSAKE